VAERPILHVKQGVSKRAVQLGKSIYLFSEDMYNVLKFHNIENTPSFTSDSYGSM
jgi:hypothetical protein